MNIIKQILMIQLATIILVVLIPFLPLSKQLRKEWLGVAHRVQWAGVLTIQAIKNQYRTLTNTW